MDGLDLKNKEFFNLVKVIFKDKPNWYKHEAASTNFATKELGLLFGARKYLFPSN